MKKAWIALSAAILLSTQAFADPKCEVCGNISANYGGIGYHGIFNVYSASTKGTESIITGNDGRMSCTNVACGERVRIGFTPYYEGLNITGTHGKCDYLGNADDTNVIVTGKLYINVPSDFELSCTEGDNIG